MVVKHLIGICLIPVILMFEALKYRLSLSTLNSEGPKNKFSGVCEISYLYVSTILLTPSSSFTISNTSFKMGGLRDSIPIF